MLLTIKKVFLEKMFNKLNIIDWAKMDQNIFDI